MKQIKAIGWDLDDTLYQRSDFYRAAFETMQKNVVHIHQSFETFYRIFEVQSDIEYEKFIREGKAKEQYQLDRILSTYKYFNCEMSVEQATIFQALNEYYRQHLTLDSEIIHVFEHLQAAGYDLFILTNGPSIDQRNKLNTLQINRWIPENRWFISEELNSSKPDIEIFNHVAEELGYLSHEFAYIGDNYTNDILGASQAGWHAIHYTHPTHRRDNPNHPTTIQHISEIINLFS